MKTRFLSLLIVFAFTVSLWAQDNKETKKKEEGYQFTTIVDLPATSVKDQYRSGTCWSFSTISFLESEMLRLGRDSVDLSEMFVVRHCYSDKATKYVRLHGSLNFGGGGAFHDVTYVLKKYGFVPEDAYPGLNYGQDKHVHGELDEVLKDYVQGVVKNPNKELSTAWHNGFDGILDAYFGKLPVEFEYKGKTYTPQSYAKEVVGLNPDDYVEITSYTHHPFYTKFAIEVPDNWLWDDVYNVPLDELKEIMHYALEKGYTIAWGADVSEKGFSHRNGIAIVPETDIKEMSGSEREKWEKLTPAERKARAYSFDGPVKEKVITQEMRQKAFDNYKTTDDHGMHITGMVKDQTGKIFYKVKNSWNTNNKYKGYFYASEPFVLYKTMDIMIHKDAIPKEIRKKLGIK
ncbi:MAG: aminopeptidase [Chlorobi bacterium]|nr:aminopeptidase [Chlorobiota bacterium]